MPSNAEFLSVPISKMVVAPETQRYFVPDHAAAMAKNFNLDGMGTVLLNSRDGQYRIVDGQHRVAALELLEMGDVEVDCEVFHDLTDQEEAALFLLRNNRRKVSSLDEFRIAVMAGLEPMTDISRIVGECGMKVAGYPGDSGIMCVKTLIAVYEKHGSKVLADTIIVLLEAYGEEHMRQQLFLGVSMVLDRYAELVDRRLLAEKLSQVPGGAFGLLGQGRSMAKQMGSQIKHCIAAAVVEQYNKASRFSSPPPRKLGNWWRDAG